MKRETPKNLLQPHVGDLTICYPASWRLRERLAVIAERRGHNRSLVAREILKPGIEAIERQLGIVNQ